MNFATKKIQLLMFFSLLYLLRELMIRPKQKKSKVPLELSKEFLILFRISGCILLSTIKSQSFVIVCKKEQQQCRIIPINQFFKLWYANVITIDYHIFR